MNVLSGFATSFDAAMSGAAAAVFDIGIRGTIVLLIAVVTVLALRRTSASVRHLVWSTALVSLLALPLLTVVLPAWQVPGLRSLTAPTVHWIRGLLAESTPESAIGATTRDFPSAPSRGIQRDRIAVSSASNARQLDRRLIAAELPVGPAIGEDDRMPAVAETSSDVAMLVRPLSWRASVFLVWLTGVVAVLAWVVLGGLVARRLARAAREITSGPVVDLLDELCYELGIATPVALLESETHSMPRTWGIRPRVLLPAEAADWSDQRLRAVLLHELAHIKRHDYLTQLLGHVAAALHWYNPLAWYAAHRMRVERERACDDRVLSTGSRPSDYAAHLLDIARSLTVGPLASATSVAMARRSQLSGRLLDVLDATRKRTGVTPGAAAVIWTAAALVVLPVAGMAATAAGAPDSAEVTATVGDMATRLEPESAVAGAFSPISEAARPNHSRGESSSPAQAVTLRRSEPVLSGSGPAPLAQQCDWYSREGDNTSTAIQSDDDRFDIKITKDRCQLRIEIVGEVEFNDAESEIIRIERGGSFEIEEREGSTRRRLEVDTDRNGDLRRRWFVDGEERSYDTEAQEWFADLLPLVFRRAGLQAEKRATRILDRQGVAGVLAEISHIPSDYVARQYFEVLLTKADLSETELREIVRQAGEELDSDYELAELLIGVAESHPVDEAVQIAYVEAAGSIDSDYETRRVLDAVLDRPGLSQDVAQAMLQLATEIDSDYELAELLIGMMERHPIEETLTPQFFDAVETLDSDYEHRRVLSAALERGAPNREILDLTLESAERLDSDYELAELLIRVGDLYPTDQTIPDSYLDAAGSIESDYERHRVLGVLVERGRLSQQSVMEVLNEASLIDSDYELAELLVDLVGRFELTDPMYEALFRATTSVGSDYERARILHAVLASGELSDAALESLLGAASDIDSDHELAELLIGVAKTHSLSSHLRDLYVEVAEDIGSEYERDRVLAALVRTGGVQ